MNYEYGKDTERQLIKQAQKGSREAFGVIIQNTERLVAQIVCRMVRQPEDRKDLAQDIYLKVFYNVSSYRFESKLSTWIAQIAYNACTDYLRKKQRSFLEVHEWQGQHGTSPDEKILRTEQNQQLQTAIESLSPVLKTLICLYHQEELSYEEIVDITGLPMGTVKNYLFRARKKLKDMLTTE